MGLGGMPSSTVAWKGFLGCLELTVPGILPTHPHPPLSWCFLVTHYFLMPSHVNQGHSFLPSSLRSGSIFWSHFPGSAAWLGLKKPGAPQRRFLQASAASVLPMIPIDYLCFLTSTGPGTPVVSHLSVIVKGKFDASSISKGHWQIRSVGNLCTEENLHVPPLKV